jgi:hypothetical protein
LIKTLRNEGHLHCRRACFGRLPSPHLEKRINQHRLVRATVVNLALISISALIFFLVRLGFNLRLLVIFVSLSVLFLVLALFTGRRSAYTLTLELFHAREALEGSDLPAKKRAD